MNPAVVPLSVTSRAPCGVHLPVISVLSIALTKVDFVVAAVTKLQSAAPVVILKCLQSVDGDARLMVTGSTVLQPQN